ncbi:MAG: cytochrome c biogenesis protein CcmE, partial [Burkholderiales bacterium]|nr:cytochrome c biogenesis protein CcmE [Burkholderiales bacterium]
MKPRNRKFAIIAGGLGALAIAVALVLNAFEGN